MQEPLYCHLAVAQETAGAPAAGHDAQKHDVYCRGSCRRCSPDGGRLPSTALGKKKIGWHSTNVAVQSVHFLLCRSLMRVRIGRLYTCNPTSSLYLTLLRSPGCPECPSSA